MKKIFITGASGLLGSNLLFHFKNKFDCYGLIYQFNYNLENVTLIKNDLVNQNSIEHIIKEIKPDYIIHTAANTNIDDCEKNQLNAHLLNVQTTKYLAKLCKNNLIKFIFISTDAFFSGEKIKHNEESKKNSLNYYAETKRLAEIEVQNTLKDYLILRTNIYGWNVQNKKSFSEWILENISNKNKIPLFNDVYFTPIYTLKLAKIIDDLIKINANGLYHAVSNQRISKYDYALLLAKTFQISNYKQYLDPISVEQSKLFAARSKEMALDNLKLKSILPNIDLSLESDLVEMKKDYDNGVVSEIKGKEYKL